MTSQGLTSSGRIRAALFAAAMALGACGPTRDGASDLKLRDMTRAEALADFTEIVNAVKGFYGPLEYKEKRFGFDIDALAAETKKELKTAKTDPEFYGAYQRFLSKLQDGHVSVSYADNSTGVKFWIVPVFLTPVEGKVLVGELLDSSLGGVGIDIGDEVLSIDGVPTLDYLPIIKKYDTVGIETTDLHWIYQALYRPVFMTELTPKSTMATLVIQKPDGEKRTLDLAWRARTFPRAKVAWPGPVASFRVGAADMFNDATRVGRDPADAGVSASLLEMGNPVPFFLTGPVSEKFQLDQVTADDDHLAKMGLTSEDSGNIGIYAARYEYKGKKILLIRQHDYAPGDWALQLQYVQKYKAILAQYEAETDVLVVDQTHNGGGSYCAEFYTIFATGEHDWPVQFNNVDRRWINTFNTFAEEVDPSLGSEEARQLLALAHEIETAYDAGKSIVDKPVSLWGTRKTRPAVDFHWKKPMLVLADELAGSCADIFPMLVRDNKRGKIFGQRTMGLGGNVEEVRELTNSQAKVRLTRGLYTTNRDDGKYTPEMMMENNGVLPDYPYTHTVADFRAGFTGYVEAFSEKAIEQIPAP
jgi:hypothetical protein